MALVSNAADRSVLGQQALDQRHSGVVLGVAAILTGDVVVVITEQRLRIGRVRPAERVGDDARPEIRDPEVVRPDL